MVSPCPLNIRLTTSDATCCSAVVGGTVRGLEMISMMDMTSAVLTSAHFVAACVFRSLTQSNLLFAYQADD